jgi:hypothetical protein
MRAKNKKFVARASPAFRMPAFASQLDRVALLLAVLAAILPVLAAFFDHAAAGRMRAFDFLRHARLAC